MSNAEPPVAKVEQELPAPPHVVYAEWLDPGALSDWMCPRPARATNIELDPTIGGRLRIDIEEDGSRFAVTGRYVDLDPPRRLSFTWSCSNWPDPTVESLVTVTLDPRGDNGTLMTIHHALLPPHLIDQHQTGWARIAEQLGAEMAAPPPSRALPPPALPSRARPPRADPEPWVPGTLPRFALVRMPTAGPTVADVESEVRRQLGAVLHPLAGRRVAITAGSRGIRDQVAALRAIAATVREAGGEPFVVPAMGSHGGATAAGQREVLAALGITDSTVGCPIDASMDTVLAGTSPAGVPLHVSRAALDAGGLIVCNRVKPHTLFTGPVESGLAKMATIGLGKDSGAQAIHQAVAARGWPAVIADVLPAVLRALPVLAGVALVENSAEGTARVAALSPDRWAAEEPALLEDARAWMPRLPVADLDLLLLDQIGKDISGAGLDPNVVGRKGAPHPPPFEAEGRITFIGVRGLSPASGGNAIGIGLAEFVRSRVLAAMDPAVTRLNALTAGDVTAAMIPFDYPTDREIVDAALCMAAPGPPRIIWARDTLHLDRMWCSEAVVRDLGPVGALRELAYDGEGNLPDDFPE